ncbi:type 1 glutamine amidotransferase domain-containing protein [Rhodococcus daqingensis]|uniref:Type 1 glutamine amidotransferase domain-containing protein n=1 Tax=Rhodococcus daqingensis TaxID=2479363 RepID=A0ABW2S197_9NOCA
MTRSLQGKKFAFLVAPEGVEQVELTELWKAILDAGGAPQLVSTAPGRISAFRHLDRADSFDVDAVVGEASAAGYDGLVLPGGVANPDFLRTRTDAVAFTKGFVDAGKPIAVICHGAWTLVEADAVRGRTLTSWPSLRTDIANAGGDWVDKAVVVCRAEPSTLVSSRRPRDLPAFCAQMVDTFAGDRNAVRPSAAG